MAEVAEHRRRAGRPRLRPAGNAGLSPRDEILHAAAGLFVSQGLAATTTRQIAERVGIRQASLYHYFAGKDEILLELLTRSLRPSLKIAEILEGRSGGRDDPAAGLYALALIDVQTLTRAPHNIAALYLLPEVQGDGYASFRAERAELQAAYGRLGKAASAVPSLDPALTAALIMQLVESVIHLRRAEELRDACRELQDACSHEIAAACLRLVGLRPEQISRARRAAGRLPSPRSADQAESVPVFPWPAGTGYDAPWMSPAWARAPAIRARSTWSARARIPDRTRAPKLREALAAWLAERPQARRGPAALFTSSRGPRPATDAITDVIDAISRRLAGRPRGQPRAAAHLRRRADPRWR